MNFQRGRSSRGSDEPDVNVIPLIDVVMVIIIFLMLTTTFSKVSTLEVNLPKGVEVTDAPPPQDVTVSITSKGIAVNSLTVGGAGDVAEIARTLERAVQPSNPDPVIVISADAQVPHQRVIDVMQAAQRAGLHRITFAVRDEGN